MVKLTEKQNQAVKLLSKNKLSLLTGGGGTGKTTLLAEWLKQTPDILTKCFAPTGKASQRMMEAFDDCGVSMGASTIHSGLIPKTVGGDVGWTFEHDADNQLLEDRFLIDESSMIGTMEMSWLLSAIPPGSQVVLIGDDYQLSPVGKGKPFRDMITSKVFPHAHLTEVHRYAGRIAHVCQQIRERGKIVSGDIIDLDVNAGTYGPENYMHFERRSPYLQLQTMDKLLMKLKEQGHDPIRDIQVIITRNTAGGLARTDVNMRLQSLLNPLGQSLPDCPFRVGDKVICKKNGKRYCYHYDGRDYSRARYRTYIANGEDGIVCGIDYRDVFVVFGKSTVKFSKSSWDKEVVLGYALTGHSTQGSGWPIAIYLVDDCMLNDNNFIYTAFSRSKQKFFSIGNLALLNKQIQRSNLDKRKTLLTEMFTGERKCPKKRNSSSDLTPSS